MIEMLWVQIPAPCTGWNLRFFTLICCKNCIEDCLKRPKINRKGQGWSILKKYKDENQNLF